MYSSQKWSRFFFKLKYVEIWRPAFKNIDMKIYVNLSYLSKKLVTIKKYIKNIANRMHPKPSKNFIKKYLVFGQSSGSAIIYVPLKKKTLTFRITFRTRIICDKSCPKIYVFVLICAQECERITHQHQRTHISIIDQRWLLWAGLVLAMVVLAIHRDKRSEEELT